MMNDDGGSGRPVKNLELSAAQQAIHDAMMEELGIGRREALPLADRGPDVNLAAIVRPRSLTVNAWTNFVFDDVDPDALPEAIADGQLYRLRRGASYNPQQSTRGARQSTHNGPHSGRESGSFGPHGGGGGRGNIGKRHEDAIAMLRSAPASQVISFRGDRGKRGAVRGGVAGRGGGGRGGRGGRAEDDRSGGRQRQAVPYVPMNLSSERFMASFNAQARAPAIKSSSGQVMEQRKTPPHLRKRVTFSTPDAPEIDAKAPDTPNIVEPHKTTPLDNSRWNPNPNTVEAAPANIVLNTSVVQSQAPRTVIPTAHEIPREPSPQVQEDCREITVAHYRGIRVRIVGNRNSYTAAYRVLQTASTRRLLIKKDIDESICINDIITPNTTLFAALDVPTTVTYSAHHQAGSVVWEIIFSLPHEAEVFQSAAMPNGPQDNLLQVAAAQVAAHIVEAQAGPLAFPAITTREAVPVRTGDIVPGITVTASGRHSILGYGAPANVEEVVDGGHPAPQQLSNVSATALLALACAEPILRIINQNQLGQFLERIYALTREVNPRSTAAEIVDSGEAYYAAELLAREFFSASDIYRYFSDAEEEQYIGVLTPHLLRLAVQERDAADPTLVPTSAGASYRAPGGTSAAAVEQDTKYGNKNDVEPQGGSTVAVIPDSEIVKVLACMSSNKENSRPMEYNPPLDLPPKSYWSSSTDSDVAHLATKTAVSGEAKHHKHTGSDVEQLARVFGGINLDSRELVQPTSSAQSVDISSGAPSVQDAGARRERGLNSLSKSRFAEPGPASAPASSNSATPVTLPTFSRAPRAPLVPFVRPALPAARQAAMDERSQRAIDSMAKSVWADDDNGPHRAVAHETRTPLSPRNENVQRNVHHRRLE